MRRLFFLAVLLGSLLPGLTSYAAQRETIRIGVETTLYYPHYGYVDGRFIGYASELLPKFAEDSGYDLVMVPYPVERLYKALFDGEIDAKYPDNPNWWRQDKAAYEMRYSVPVTRYVDGVMVLPDRVGLPMHALQHLGTIKGFSLPAYESSVTSGLRKLTETRDADSLLKRTLDGFLDGAYMNVDVARHCLAVMFNDADGLVFDDGLPHTESYYHLSSPTRPDVIEAFNVWMKEARDWRAQKARKYGIKLP